MGNIIIGKHALESLTTGMYFDPFVIFREYIQNSADSIDEAVHNGVIIKEENKIEVILSPIERKISIGDNGMGIPLVEVEQTLISVGNSKKIQNVSRGFRGIGRLAALSYCGKLVFETSYIGERKGTRLIIDAKKLSEKLLLEENDVSAEDVLADVYIIEHFPEYERRHYFNVIMEELENDSELNDYELVYEYLSQNVPVSYDSRKFAWGKEIKLRLKNEGCNISEYNVYLTFAGNTVQIYKPYMDDFQIDKNGNVMDHVRDIQIIKLFGSQGEISAYGWVATTDYLGSVYNKTIKGIRIRKGNILIGDGQTLNVCFKDARFNGWTLGEIFVVDPQLIPNARRDNFEKNSTYFVFTEQIRNVAANIVKAIRNASAQRNTDLSKVIDKSQNVKIVVEEAMETNGLDMSKKASLRKRLVETKAELNAFSLDDTVDLYNKEIAFEEIDMLIGKLQGATAYKSLNSIQSISKPEKRILEKVFDVIVSVKPDESEELIDSILKVFVNKDLIH